MLETYFINFGYTHEEYLLIRNSYSIIEYKDETLIEKFQTITKFLLNNNYTKEEVIKIAIKLPQIYALSIETIRKKTQDVMELGYSKEEVIKMTKTLPQIYSYNVETMKQKIQDVMEIGYSKEEVIKMTKTLPSIYSYNIENMKQKIQDVMELGYSKEEVIKMTKTLPSIYGLSIENMKQKIDFYNSIDMHSLAVIDTKQLMQSTALSYARYHFYLSKDILINMDNYRKLFISNKQFEERYGITKEGLLSRYDYQNDEENKKNGRIV